MTLSLNCTTASGREGAASANARRLSSSLSASFANEFACFRKASSLACVGFGFLMMNSASSLAALTETSDAS